MGRGARKEHYFITGVSAGIGKALVEALVANGHHVSGVARRAEKLAEMEACLDGFKGYVGDVSEKQAISAIISQATKEFGPIDVLIPNAGIYVPDTPHSIDCEQFETHMQVNYMASIYCLADIMPSMIARKSGKIALMASVAGYRGLPRSLAYGPTKAALINLAEALRFDLQGTGVTIQVICPGFVETEATSVNDFVMPDLISPQTAADEIIKGLSGSAFEIAFPKRFARKMKWLTYLSNDLYFKLVSKATK